MSIRGQPLCNLRFAGNIDLLGGNAEKLKQLDLRSDCMENTAIVYAIEINSDKSKILINSIKPKQATNIWMNGKTLEEVGEFNVPIHTN